MFFLKKAAGGSNPRSTRTKSTRHPQKQQSRVVTRKRAGLRVFWGVKKNRHKKGVKKAKKPKKRRKKEKKKKKKQFPAFEKEMPEKKVVTGWGGGGPSLKKKQTQKPFGG